MKNSFLELRVTSEGTERRFVRRAGEEITIGTDSAKRLLIDDPSAAPERAKFYWAGNEELKVESAGTLQIDGKAIESPASVCPEQRVTVGNITVSWRWLALEEFPTITGGGPATRALSGAAAELAAELSNGRYQSGPEVGRGGMGRVLQAMEKPLRRSVALKVLLDRGEDEDQKRFIREARITGRLEHPSIVPVHELNVDEAGHVFYTMKLVRGVTLLQILQDLTLRKPDALKGYPLPALLTVFQKVCDAVAFAHAQAERIIHRDLKPENIMVGDYGEVLVMDWGAAKVLGANGSPEDLDPIAEDYISDGDEKETEALFLTQPGSVMGTPGYMAPEQARGQAASADERTDIYALGAILYSLLTLDAPLKMTGREAHDFEDRSLAGENVTRIFRKSVAPLLADPTLRPKLPHLPARTVPDSLVAVVFKAMAVRPADRFASVKKLQADVAAYQAGFATSAEEARAWRRFKLLVARNKTLFTALGAIFMILLAATAISLHQRQTAIASNKALQGNLRQASLADHEAARQRFRSGAWREGLALMGRALTFWPDNREAANYLLSAIRFGRGDSDRLPIFGVHHRAAIVEAVFSPDGRSFATASYDHTTRVWDAATGREIGKPLHHAGPCGRPCFSPDSRQLVTTGGDGIAMLWDVQTGEHLAEPMRHGRPELDSRSDVLACIYSPDGKHILTNSMDHTTRVWDAASGKEIAQMVNPHRVAEVVFSPDGSRILTSYWYGGAILWDAKTFQPIGAPMVHAATVRKALFSPDGNKIVTTSLDKTARIWDGHTAQSTSPPLSHPDFVWNLAMSPDGKLFATACYDKAVRLWSLTDGSPVGVPMEHDGPVNTVEFSPDGSRLLSASRDKTARLWDTRTCQPLGPPMRHDETVMGAVFNPDGTKILSFGWDGAAYVWNTEPPPWPGEIIPIPGEMRSIEFAGNDDLVFVATRNGQAGLWSLSKNEFVGPVAHHRAAISAGVFHPSSRQSATAGTDGIVRFWNAASGKELGETKAGNDTIVAIAFSADGNSLFAAYLSGSVVQWKVPEGTQIGDVMKHSEKMDALAVAPSGKELATGCRDDFLHFWEATSGNALPRKIRHGNPVLAIDYHPNGNSIATGCEDHTARLWSLSSGEQTGEPFPLKGRATAVRYTAGGNALLVGGLDDTEVNCYHTTTRKSLYPPLPHSNGVTEITSNADGSIVITVTNDGAARLWRIPRTAQPPPTWLPEYLRAIGGLTFSAGQQLLPVPTQERVATRAKLLGAGLRSSGWEEVMASSFQGSETRAADLSSETPPR